MLNGIFPSQRLSMQFFLMDLIGPFDPSSNGHYYALTVICMLTRYTFCVPLKTETAGEVIQAYIDEVYPKVWESLKIMMGNGTEFKNQLFTDVATQLGVKGRVYFPSCHPQSNGTIEGFHNSLNAHMSKHKSKSLEWNQVILLACTVYNLLPIMH